MEDEVYTFQSWKDSFDSLIPKSGIKLRVNLPHTILVNDKKEIVAWFHTSYAGYITKKSVQRTTFKDAVTELCANMFVDKSINPNLYVAVASFTDGRSVLLRRSDILKISMEAEAAEANEQANKLDDKLNSQFQKPFMLQLYMPPSLDRRYICVYQSDLSTGKVNFDIMIRKYSERYTNSLDDMVSRTVDGAKNAMQSQELKTLEISIQALTTEVIKEHPRDFSFKPDIRKSVTSLVNFMERTNGVRVTGVILEYIRGLEGRPWLVNISSLHLAGKAKPSRGKNVFANESTTKSSSQTPKKGLTRPRSATPNGTPTKQSLQARSRPSSATTKMRTPHSSSKSHKRLSYQMENSFSADTGLAQALTQDIECLKEKLQLQGDILENTKTALKREIEQRKEDNFHSVSNKAILVQENKELRSENENMKKKLEELQSAHSKMQLECSSLRIERVAKEEEVKKWVKVFTVAKKDKDNTFKNLETENMKLKEDLSTQTELASTLKNRLDEEQETVAAVRAQLVSLRKKVLDTEAKNKELDMKILNYSKNTKSVRRINPPENPHLMAVRAEQVVNSLKLHDLLVDYEPGFEEEKENEDAQVIRNKICEVLCNNVEVLQDIYEFYAQLGEVERQRNMLLQSHEQFLKFSRDIGFFENSVDESKTASEIEVVFSRIVSKDDQNKKITFIGFLEGICRLVYARNNENFRILLTEEDQGSKSERQEKLQTQTKVAMTFLSDMLNKARCNKLGGSKTMKEKREWKSALSKSLRMSNVSKILSAKNKA